ncbi:hybrid sensor histidine kinase/response regulator [Luteimonas sp. MC1895]|uniref:hybrid sensor histidine kinase/response regulator n=1 Tax=Luteimonas sp. MC1895 TaxID=2819513 RepID=UPI0018F0F579|nr:hybrid sensor histidine kinase/response regulator [Luteimonas sp. MC1895]MBJ6978654.1 response regulator [Luteimonas sp. MC1895]
MRRWTVCLLLCLLWLLAGAAGAAVPQMPQPRQISVIDGLPSNRVNALAEDRRGYLWIATRDGLARYDGVGFRTWRVGDGLRDNFVWSVHVDAADRVWIGTSTSGLAMLDVTREHFTWHDRATHPEMASNDVWSVASTPDGDVWFGTADGGLHRLSPDGRMRRYRHDPDDATSLPADGVSHLVVDDRDGTLWVGTKGGVARWTGDGFARLPPERLGTRMVDGLALDAAGSLWMGIHGAGRVRHADGRIESLPWLDPVLGEPALNMLLEDGQGARWLDTRSGLAWVRGDRVDNVPLYSTTSRGLVRPAWSTAYEDREGGLWFASTDAGLWHLPANWRNFSVLQRRLGDPASLANAFVYSAAPASQGQGRGLWLVGTGGALDHLEPETGEIGHRLGPVCGTLFITGVIEVRDGHVWLGCQDHLVRFDPRSGALRRWLADGTRDAAPAGRIAQFVEQRDGTVWLASHQSVQARAPDGPVLDTIDRGSGRGLDDTDAVEQLMLAPDGGLWVATSGGLLAWDAGARRFAPVPGAPEAAVYSVAIAGDGTVWLAGYGELSSWAWDGASLRPLRVVGSAEGLPMVAPGGVMVDADGVVWLTTVRGLVRFDPEDARLRVYGVRDGLPSHEFSEFPMAMSAQGYIAAGTADGLLLFHPRQVVWSQRMPTLAIESVDLRRGDARIALSPQSRLSLRHDDRDLRVVARLLSFTDAHAHRYRFRLEGYDPGWVDTGAAGERVFARLEPGAYRLHVQARTADDEWTPVQLLQLHVQPPWWQAPWALALFAVAAALLLLWSAHAYRLRLKRRHGWQLNEEKRVLAEQASLAKTRFLATLGHEVRTPMTGVLGMSELLLGTTLDARQRGYADAIRHAGEHLMRLVNDALDLARIEAGKLELVVQPFDLVALLDEVAGLVEPLARRRGLAFRRHVDARTPRWLMGDAGRVRQVLLNLLGNAVKFTETGSVTLQAAPIATGGVRLVVSDTGPGLNEEQQAHLFRRFEQADGARTAARYGGSGLGLAICQELAMAMGGRVELDSTPGQGTDFTVDLPLPEARPPEGAAATDGGPARDATRPGLSLLLVEDDPTVAAVIAGLLRAHHHEVVHVPHGLAALSEVASERFDMALLDLDLPGITGLALASQLRAQGFLAPLLAITARADAEAEVVAREAGFDGFLRKPVTGAMLGSAIDTLRSGNGA